MGNDQSDEYGARIRTVTNELVTTLLEELRVSARQMMANERRDHTLRPTALVNEAYLRLSKSPSHRWENEGHFMRAAAQAMRCILVDHARRRGRLKRGGDRDRAPLDGISVHLNLSNADLLALDEALARLEERDPVGAEIVKLRFFGGRTNKDIAQILDCSLSSVTNKWRIVRAELQQALSTEEASG